MTDSASTTGALVTRDIALAYAEERDAFVHDLARLDPDQWRASSLCAGWDVRDVVAHLMMPFELGGAAFLGRMIAARFSFDRLALTWATRDQRTPAELQRSLAATTVEGFNVPGAGPLAPLAHLSIHAHDVRGPLGISTGTGPAAARLVLADLTVGRHALPVSRLRGLHLQATDTEWEHGQGQQVTGPAGALLSALGGRAAAVDHLAGDGVSMFRNRLT